jgi:hypothetical protein
MKLLKHLIPTLFAGVVLLASPDVTAADKTADKAPAASEKPKTDNPSNESLSPEERAKRRKEAALPKISSRLPCSSRNSLSSCSILMASKRANWRKRMSKMSSS